MFGKNTTAVTCAEAGLFLWPETEVLTFPYLNAVRKAGTEYKQAGRIAEETQKVLDTPMIPREEYLFNTNAVFSAMKREK
jgi:hypothetical protein